MTYSGQNTPHAPASSDQEFAQYALLLLGRQRGHLTPAAERPPRWSMRAAKHIAILLLGKRNRVVDGLVVPLDHEQHGGNGTGRLGVRGVPTGRLEILAQELLALSMDPLGSNFALRCGMRVIAEGQSLEAGGQQRLLDGQEGLSVSVPVERVDYRAQ